MIRNSFIALFVFITTLSFSQGCSDAGFCTIGNVPHQTQDSTRVNKHKLGLLFTNGIGDEGVYVFTPALQYDLELPNAFSFQSRLTGNYASGNLGSVFAPGDLYVSGSYNYSKSGNFKQVFTLGTKLPLNQSDLTANGKSLPMQYQSSLGTIDLIVLYAVQIKKIALNVGLQQPLTGANQNAFLPSNWNTEDALNYPPSNAFKRKGDVLVRLAYDLISNSKLKWNASLLSIYHVAEDEYTDRLINKDPIAIVGSKGLTLNLTTSFFYTISKKFSFTIVAGTPLIVRDIRPDGLTRAFVISPQFNYHF